MRVLAFLGEAPRPQDYLGAALIVVAGVLLLKLRTMKKEAGAEI